MSAKPEPCEPVTPSSLHASSLEPALADKAIQRESARQAAVLAAWRAPLPVNATLDKAQPCMPALKEAGLRTDIAGLRAYQGHARALACRVIAGTFPTLVAMLGRESLDNLAVNLWSRRPPVSGDLAEWGEALPSLIEAHEDLQDWPWLTDSARLDWACHTCERAADADLDTDSLHRLGDTPGNALSLQLKPNLRLLDSRWPIAALLAAHRLPQAQQLDAAKRALADGARGPVLVWRRSWEAQARVLPESWANWMAGWMTSVTAGRAAGGAASEIEAGTDPKPQPHLAEMLDKAPADFDFTAWLTTALQEDWLWRVADGQAAVKDRSAGS